MVISWAARHGLEKNTRLSAIIAMNGMTKIGGNNIIRVRQRRLLALSLLSAPSRLPVLSRRAALSPLLARSLLLAPRLRQTQRLFPVLSFWSPADITTETVVIGIPRGGTIPTIVTIRTTGQFIAASGPRIRWSRIFRPD